MPCVIPDRAGGRVYAEHPNRMADPRDINRVAGKRDGLVSLSPGEVRIQKPLRRNLRLRERQRVSVAGRSITISPRHSRSTCPRPILPVPAPEPIMP